MGLFTSIKSNFKKSEAAVIVQNLLEQQSHLGMFHADAAKAANGLVTAIWEQKPDLFDGKFGQRPHKVSVAAAALANGAYNLADSNANKAGIVIALGNLLSHLQVNVHLYPLTGADDELIDRAVEAFEELAT